MSPSPTPLPAHPSVPQLRKRAKELLRQLRAGDPQAADRFRAVRVSDAKGDARDLKLADAQFVLAREHGFSSWPELVGHLEAVQPSRVRAFEELVQDLVSVYRTGDVDALRRLETNLPGSGGQQRIRALVDRHLEALSLSLSPGDHLSIDHVRLIVARHFGFAGWDDLMESTAQPPSDIRTAPLGISQTPPFYRLDRHTNTLELSQILSADDWDTVLGVMQEMDVTGLRANGQLTDDALRRLSQLEHVTHIDFGGTKRITDEGLLHLSNMPALRMIDVSDSPGGQITDRGLGVLRHLPELRTFQMGWQSAVSDEGVGNLRYCRRLERVDLMGTPTGDGAVEALTGLTALSHLKTGKFVTDRGLRRLQQVPAFHSWRGGDARYGLMDFEAGPTYLSIDGPFTNHGLKAVAALHGLFALNIFWHATEFTADGLAELSALPHLGFLGCDGKRCDDRAMHHIGTLRHLRMLMAQGTIAGDDGFAALSRSERIEYIWGRECPNLSGRGFQALASMPALRGLAVSCRRVDDAGLAALPRFPSLTALMPMDVSDDGFRHVGRCRGLEELWCMYCRDTGDTATGHLTELPGLRTYYAGHTRITDRSLEILGTMSSLERVQLHRCGQISDVGLAFLAPLPRLREVSIEGSPNVTRAGLTVFPATVRVTYGS